jgi:lipopolysaccharide/colanic/teichoic acid biosynthesis glycosyltransferase
MPEPVTMIAVGSGIAGLAGHLARRYFETAKEVVDIVLGSIAFVLALPVLALCAAIIKLSSKGPVLFRQERVGRDGQPFTMLKFRSMYVGAEAESGAVWASKGDSRIIPGCRWMRLSHMDELPQIINVIRGEMSLVGPRPERPEILAELEKQYPDVRKRLAVRPGITGLAQIRNGYDTTVDAFRHKLMADLEYIEKRRWGMELGILVRTIGKIRDKDAC